MFRLPGSSWPVLSAIGRCPRLTRALHFAQNLKIADRYLGNTTDMIQDRNSKRWRRRASIRNPHDFAMVMTPIRASAASPTGAELRRVEIGGTIMLRFKCHQENEENRLVPYKTDR